MNAAYSNSYHAESLTNVEALITLDSGSLNDRKRIFEYVMLLQQCQGLRDLQVFISILGIYSDPASPTPGLLLQGDGPRWNL